VTRALCLDEQTVAESVPIAKFFETLGRYDESRQPSSDENILSRPCIRLQSDSLKSSHVANAALCAGPRPFIFNFRLALVDCGTAPSWNDVKIIWRLIWNICTTDNHFSNLGRCKSKQPGQTGPKKLIFESPAGEKVISHAEGQISKSPSPRFKFNSDWRERIHRSNETAAFRAARGIVALFSWTEKEVRQRIVVPGWRMFENIEIHWRLLHSPFGNRAIKSGSLYLARRNSSNSSGVIPGLLRMCFAISLSRLRCHCW
jgi:hypothetical protein